MESSYYHVSTTTGVLLAQMIIEDAIFNLRIISSIVRILQFFNNGMLIFKSLLEYSELLSSCNNQRIIAMRGLKVRFSGKIFILQEFKNWFKHHVPCWTRDLQ